MTRKAGLKETLQSSRIGADRLIAKGSLIRMAGTAKGTDLLVVNRAGIDRKVSLAELRPPITDLEKLPGPPWEGHDGGIFHIKNASGRFDLHGGPYTAWDLDGTNEREITYISGSEELVFITSPEAVGVFGEGGFKTWDFGNETDTSQVTNMSRLFKKALSFDSDISDWDTSNVTDMSHMFDNSQGFNQDLSRWDTSNVTNMASMFSGAREFEGDLNNWKTSKVIDMSNMFNRAILFSSDLNGWDTSSVTNMQSMFGGAGKFNGDISSWNTGKVTDMSQMFDEAEKFNCDIGDWDTGNVTTMSKMFRRAKAFNMDINKWETAKVDDMDQMFYYAAEFNQTIRSWCVELIRNKPPQFDYYSGFAGASSRQPRWGYCID